MACYPSIPAPTISNVGTYSGVDTSSVVVSWETDAEVDSLAIFREQGTSEWIQVGTPARTRIHQVQVRNRYPDKFD